MKTKVMTQTVIDPPKKVGKKTKNVAKTLTLDEIEEKMIELATQDGDVLQTMMNEKKIAMLEKVANFKLHRLQLKELEKQTNVVEEVKPLEIVFVDGQTESQQERIQRIDNEILTNRTNNNNA